MFKNIFFAMALLCSLLACSKNVEPPKQFLQSKVVTPLGMNNFPFGELTVTDFQSKLVKKQLDNGKYPEVLGWKNADNVYTLIVMMKGKRFSLVFNHLLSKDQGGGLYSVMAGECDGQVIPGTEIMQFLMM
jgi:hypothetical protein